MGGIFKRLLNVATVLCSLFLLLLCFLMVTGNVSDWGAFLWYNFGSLALAYAAIAAINYVSFGSITLWHKNTTSTRKHHELR